MLFCSSGDLDNMPVCLFSPLRTAIPACSLTVAARVRLATTGVVSARQPTVCDRFDTRALRRPASPYRSLLTDALETGRSGRKTGRPAPARSCIAWTTVPSGAGMADGGAATTVPAAIPAEGRFTGVRRVLRASDRLAIKYRDRGNYEYLDLRQRRRNLFNGVRRDGRALDADGDSALVLSSREGRFGIYRQPVGQVARGPRFSRTSTEQAFGAVTPTAARSCSPRTTGQIWGTSFSRLCAKERGRPRWSPLPQRTSASPLCGWPLVSYFESREAGDAVLYVAPFQPASRRSCRARDSSTRVGLGLRRAPSFSSGRDPNAGRALDSDGRPGLPRTLFDRAFIPFTNKYDVAATDGFAATSCGQSQLILHDPSWVARTRGAK